MKIRQFASANGRQIKSDWKSRYGLLPFHLLCKQFLCWDLKYYHCFLVWVQYTRTDTAFLSFPAGNLFSTISLCSTTRKPPDIWNFPCHTNELIIREVITDKAGFLPLQIKKHCFTETSYTFQNSLWIDWPQNCIQRFLIKLNLLSGKHVN